MPCDRRRRRTRFLRDSAGGGRKGVAEITVKNHLSAIFNKLGVSNRSEAVAIALRKHLLKV